MSSFSSRLGLPYLTTGVGDNIVVHNRALTRVDALSMPMVKTRNLTTPPGSPSAGQMWIVKATGAGAWSGKSHNLAYWTGTAWEFFAPVVGMQVWVEDEKVVATYLGSNVWSASVGEAMFAAKKTSGNNQTVSTTVASWLDVQWNSQIVDISNSRVYAHSTSSNPHQITLVEAGDYDVEVQLGFEATGTAVWVQLDAQLVLDGSAVPEATSYATIRPTDMPRSTLTLCRVINAAAGQVLSVQTTRQTTSGSTTITLNENTRIRIRKR